MAQQWQSGEHRESGWGSGGGASSGGDSGGGWTGNDWTGPGGTLWPMPPAPPDSHFLTEVFGKGYNKGWNEGHSAGFGNGYQSAVQALYGDAMWGGKGKGSGGWREEEAEAAEPGGKKKHKKKSGSSWKEWSGKYTAIDSDKEETRFYTRLGGQKVATYPQEIQEELLKATEESEAEGVSKDIVYDMTGGWLYKLRIFGGSEKECWEETLSEIRAGDGKPDGTLVGAQWKMKEAMAEPPKVFEKGVKYRPIFYSE